VLDVKAPVILPFQAFELGFLRASFSSLSLSCLELITVQPIQIITSIITKMPSDPAPGNIGPAAPPSALLAAVK
jgi:hypothetical protein